MFGFNTRKGGSFMPIVNKDEVKGKIHRAKGAIKDKAGELTGNRKLEAEGEAENAAGKGQETWGKFKRGVSNVIESAADAVNK